MFWCVQLIFQENSSNPIFVVSQL